MIQQNNESPLVIPVPDQLYLSVRDMLFAYKEWPDLQEMYPDDFIEGLKNACTYEWTLNIQQDQEGYYFQGYPTGNLIKLFWVVLTLWNQDYAFPIRYKKVSGLDQDETSLEVETLCKLTSDVEDVFAALHQNDTQILFIEIKDLLVALKPRGFLTWLGIRKTYGSKDVWPPPLSYVFEHFNRRYIYLTPKQLAEHENPPKISIGARALSKHAHRDSQGFWGKVIGLSEEDRNKKAFEKFKEIIRDWVWVNIHCLPPDIIEWRIKEGYGCRWTTDQEFRGFVEPVFPEGHHKKWRH